MRVKDDAIIKQVQIIAAYTFLNLNKILNYIVWIYIYIFLKIGN